jgi:hypothetical protein
MVDRQYRRILAGAVRHLAAGRITWGDFDRLVYPAQQDSDDPALPAIYTAMRKWHDGNLLEWLAPHPPHDGCRDLARMVLFLYTDLEYRWQEPTLADAFAALLDWKALLAPFLRKQHAAPLDWQPNHFLWPFYTAEEYAAAQSGTFLLGSEESCAPPETRIQPPGVRARK